MLTLDDLNKEAVQLLADVPEGAALEAVAKGLIEVGVTQTSLDGDQIDAAIGRALGRGATVDQIQEIVALVSALGIHSVMIAAPILLRRSPDAVQGPLDDDRRRLWEEFIGTDPYWIEFEAEFPGFLDALLRLSPNLFRRFHQYCAVPWESGLVRGVTKELVAMACDATPTHRFRPGFRLHLRNALKLGAGRSAVLQALAIASVAPDHIGFYG